ncbi:MAG: hypothetical protein NT167_31835 [Verrucomicrobia bacterium]|nr:hypothetical protein [Verrucomicrobiota bacterium]
MKDKLLTLFFALCVFFGGQSGLPAARMEFDRIGPDSALTDGLPGALAVAYPPATNGLGDVVVSWGCAGIRWTQSVSAAASEARFVVFARTDSGPLTNLSQFHLNWHLWTNGAAGFFSRPQQGDVVVDGGIGPSAPAVFGTTTNLGVVYPTCLLALPLTTSSVSLEAGREYVMALVFRSDTVTNLVVRQIESRSTGASDVVGGFNISNPTNCGYASGLGFAQPQFAAALLVENGVTLSIESVPAGVKVSWPLGTSHLGLETTTNLSSGTWQTLPESLGTNALTLPADEKTKFLRLRLR